MTPDQIDTLKKLSTAKDGLHYYDDVDGNGREILEHLCARGFCQMLSLDPPQYYITQDGLESLCELEERAKQKADEKRQQRFQNKISVPRVLVPLVTFILGLIVEHFAGIVAFLASSLH